MVSKKKTLRQRMYDYLLKEPGQYKGLQDFYDHFKAITTSKKNAIRNALRVCPGQFLRHNRYKGFYKAGSYD